METLAKSQNDLRKNEILPQKRPFIKEIQLKNILLYSDTRINLQSGITLITGPNGAGKSLLLDVIRMGLGLNARSVRMNTVGEYRQDKSTDATITLSLTNPVLSEVGRFLRTNSTEFNTDFLSRDELVLRRTITKRGDSFFSIGLPNGNWVQLDADKRQLLEEAFARVGISPKDPITFISGEDYSGFIDKSAHQRYELMMSKLGLRDAEGEYQKTAQQIEDNREKHAHIEDDLQSARKEADILRLKAEKYQTLEIKEQELQAIANELAWSPVKIAEEKIKATENKILDLSHQLEQISQQELQEAEHNSKLNEESKKIVNILDEQKKAVKNINDKYKGLEVNIQRDQQNIDNIKKNKAKHLQGIKEKTLHAGEIEKELQHLTNLQLSNITDQSSNQKLFTDYNNEIAQLEKQEKELDKQESTIRKRYQDKIQIVRKEEDKSISEKAHLQREIYSLEQPKQKNANIIISKPYRERDRVTGIKTLIKKLQVDDKVIGPLYAVVQPRKGEEYWQKALTLAFKGELFDFVTDDKEVFNRLVDYRKKEGLTDIRLGYVDHSKTKERHNRAFTDVEKKAGFYKNCLDAIDGHPIVISYLKNWISKTILCEHQSPIPVDLYQGYVGRFITADLEVFEAREGSTRTNKSRGTILGDSPLLGTPWIEPANSSNTDAMTKQLLENKLAILEKSIKDSSTQISFLENERDAQIVQIRQVFTNIIERKKTLKDLVSKLQSSLGIDKDQSLINQLQVDLNTLRQQIASQQNDLVTFDNELHLFEQKIAEKKLELFVQNKLAKQAFAEEVKLTTEQQHLHDQITQSQLLVTALHKSIEQLQKDLTKGKQELEVQKKETVVLSQHAKIIALERPDSIRIPTLLKDLQQKLLNEKAKLLKEGVKREDLERYQTHKNLVVGLEQRIREAKEEYDKLQVSLEHWHIKWDDIFTTRVTKVQQMYQAILGSINAKGRIELVNALDLDHGQASFYVQFQFEEEREIQDHSTGQKQTALVALVLALQSLSSAPVTAIDEFDHGLDIFSKATLMEIVPALIEQTVTFMANEHDIYKYTVLDNQMLFICPEIDTATLPEQINFLTITRKPHIH